MLDILPFTKFTKEPLPPRVRSLLEGAYQAAWQVLEPTLKRIVVDYEQALFKDADKAHSTQEQSDYFAAMREVRKHAVDLEVAVRDVLQRGIVSMVTREGQREQAARATTQRSAKLGLIETADLEESLALSEFSAKAEMRFNASLHHLSYRFAAIAGSAPIEHELLPLGPNAMADGLRAAGHSMDLSVEQRVRFYHFAERGLLLCYESLLNQVNENLAAHKVLPNFHLMSQRSKQSPVATAKEPEAAAQKGPEKPSEESRATDPAPQQNLAPPGTNYAAPGQPAPGQYSQSRPSAPVPGSRQTAPDTAFNYDPQRPAFSALHELWRDPQQQSAPARPSHEPSEEDQAELFTTLRELMSGRRAQAGIRTSADNRPAAAPADVQAVLSVLQTQPAVPVMVGGRWQSRKVGDIKQDLLNQLRALGDGTPPKLSAEDNDTVDLVGMLFEQLTQGLSPVSLSHGLMTKLQVPLLKVALNDKGFFTRRKHPARLLLNEVAEAASLWIEDEDADRAVLDKMQLVVDRITRDYDQDHQVFEQQLQDLGGHLQQVRRKADVAEKRQVDAARGREKMELSRAAAVESIMARIEPAQPPKAVRTFLLEAWTDVLALALLRQGPQGADFEAELDCVDELLALTDKDVPLDKRRGRFVILVKKLENGVSAVGMHNDVFAKAKIALFDALELHSVDKPAPQTDTSGEAISEALKNRPRLGGEPGAEPVATILAGLRRGERGNLSPEEKAMVERIKQLPFGTWFDFVKNQQGERMTRKLSWFSPVTGRCLFVNPRGAKAEDKTIEQLARELVRGTARVVVETKERLIDRAWKAIVNAFKGGDRNLEEALVEAQS